MTEREKDLLARHCLLNLHRVAELWQGRDWGKLAVVVCYARRGIPVDMSLTDPFMYRKLCAGLCEFHIRGYGRLNLAAIEELARRAEAPTTTP